MELDYERSKEKEKEILELIESHLEEFIVGEDDRRQLAELIRTTSVRIAPPEKERIVLHLVTLTASGRGGGKSTKPGNIRLNMGGLMESVANCVFAVVSSYQIPWLAPFAFIMLWKSLWRGAEINLTENDAAVIYSMWVYRDRNNNEIQKNSLLTYVNNHLQKYGRLLITQKDLEYSIANLTAIGCIKQSRTNPGNWWLCEWVQPVY